LRVDLVLHNGKVFTNGEIHDAGIAIESGKIVKIAKEPNLPSFSHRIDLNGNLLLPGVIDIHVHLRGQLQAYEEDFFTGTAAAVAGGITTVLDMPNNTPVTMDSAALKDRVDAAEDRIVSNVGFFSALPPKLEEIERVVKTGAKGFKLFLTTQIGGMDIDDDKALRQAFDEIAKLRVPVAVHAEDREMVEKGAEKEKKLGHKSVEAYLKAHTPEAEAKAVERIIKLTHQSSVHIHFCHLSSTRAVTLIDTARKGGMNVSCEATPHHFSLTHDDLKKQGTMLLTDPPLRGRSVAAALFRAIKSGQIDAIASDHAPHLLEEKTADSVWDVKPGIPGLETLLPLLLTKVNERKLSISELVRLTSTRPAEIFHLHNAGSLEEGYNADITVVDMHRRSRIDASTFHSKAKYSPFDHWRVKGMPVRTFVNGRQVMEEGEITAEGGAGRVLSSLL
jgi:dihydroorotase (multifunctional complex type)